MASARTFDDFLPEITAIVGSTVCLIAIVIVLRIYTNKLTPTLPYGITLNAIIATLATTSRSMLMFAVAATVSQLKWCWYQDKRRLQDLQIFDDASRGPWGAVVLLCSQPAISLASLGALITVLALAFDPFVQLILSYPSRAVVSETVFPPSLSRATDFMIDPTSDAWNNAVEAGIWGESEQFYQRPGCPTGNCTWPDFHSIGWCSKCQDATSHLQITNCNLTELIRDPPQPNESTCMASLGHGRSVSLHGGGEKREGLGDYNMLNLTIDTVWMLSVTNQSLPSFLNATYLGVPNPVVAIAHVSMAYKYKYPQLFHTLEDINFAATAEECILTVCDTKYEVLTTDGVSKTNTPETNYGLIRQYKYHGLRHTADPIVFHLPVTYGQAAGRQTVTPPNGPLEWAIPAIAIRCFVQ